MVVIVNSARVYSVLGVTAADPATAGDVLDHRGSETGHFYTIGEIVTHPIESLMFFFGSVTHEMGYYVKTMLGGILGWIQVDISTTPWEDFCMFVPLVLGTLRSKDDGEALDRVPRIAFCLSALLGAGAILMTMWVSWTFHTDAFIAGVQGRYMLPFLPALMLGIRPKRLQVPVRLGPSILLGLSSFACFYWAQICYLVTV